MRIEWQAEARNGAREFKLSWQESGGPPAARPKKKGFGSAIIENMIARSVLGAVTVS